ncbi:MAG TPA: hypothetical protein VNJ01_02285 [Bacteriovoracaceae bacterium]|nr:hypothetical protein [Bacteriovoracaceae bacterium]
MNLFLIFLFFIPASFAQTFPSSSQPFPSEESQIVPTTSQGTESKVEQAVEEASEVSDDSVTATAPSTEVEEVVRPYLHSRDHRDASTGTIMVGYQLLTTWLPFKLTASYTHIFNRKWSTELEYTSGSLSDPIPGVDLGRIKEKRISLVARRYTGNSFHFIFGGYFNDFDAHLGSSILSQMGSVPESGFRVQGLGLATGIGNRWQWQNGITAGIDWLRVNIPLIETRVEDKVLKDISDDSDRGDVKEVISAFNDIPTFVLFGLNVGYTF